MDKELLKNVEIPDYPDSNDFAYISPKYDQDNTVDVNIEEYNEYFKKIKSNRNIITLILKDGVPDPSTFKQLASLESLKSFEISNIKTDDLDKLDEIFQILADATTIIQLTLHNSYQLNKVPDSLCSIMTLKELRIYFTGVEYLPKDIGNLVSLEELDICDNQFGELPNSFIKLQKLKSIRIDNDDFIKYINFLKGNIESLDEVLHMDKNFENILEK